AAFRSSTSADGTVAHTSSVAGLMTSIVLPDDAGRHSLLMKSCFCSAAVAVIGVRLTDVAVRAVATCPRRPACASPGWRAGLPSHLHPGTAAAAVRVRARDLRGNRLRRPTGRPA